MAQVKQKGMLKSKISNLEDHPQVTNFVILDDRRTAGDGGFSRRRRVFRCFFVFQSMSAPWNWNIHLHLASIYGRCRYINSCSIHGASGNALYDDVQNQQRGLFHGSKRHHNCPCLSCLQCVEM